MDNYPGNSSLADEVKRRIVGTYEQSVELAERGRSQEAILGCDFVLELDPQFAPAQALRQRLASGDSAPPAVEEPASTPPGGGAAPPSDAGADEFFDFDSMGSLDLPELDLGSGSASDTGADAPPSGAGDGLGARLRERLEARDFQGVLDEAGQEREAVVADPELAAITETAQARIEAQPYVESFLRDAGAAIRGGDLDRADGLLERARSLDPDHPLLEGQESSLRRARGGAEEVAPAAPPSDPADTLDDFDLLDGFELPKPSPGSPSGPEGWEDEGAPQAQPEDDPFSLDPQELDAPEGLGTAPELEAPGGPGPSAGTGGGPDEPARAPGTAKGEDRITELLAEGQRAADGGDHQGAIDAWSRIFLIDVDHQEAARRIEKARRSKAERERKVEEVFHEGLSALEAGQTDAAREHFERVLEMHPNHLAARDYLRQIESGEPVKVTRGPTPDETVALGGADAFDLSDLGGPRAASDDGTLREEILVPPPPPGDAAAEPEATVPVLPGYGKGTAVKRESGRRSFLLVGGLVLLLVAVAAWWLFTNKDRFFPNSDAPEETAAGAPAEAGAPGPIERATALHERGQTAMALGLLKRIRPDDPRHEEAQELVAQWESPPETGEEDGAEAVPVEAQDRRERLLAAAESTRRRGENLVAAELYDRAAQIAPLAGEAEEGRRAVERQLEPLREEVELFELGEYEMLLPRLWRLYEEDRSNQDVRRMLVDSYYNRGARQLQRGDAAAAAAEFEEALGVDPDDEQIQRHFLFAQTYERRPKDLLYRIYVKHLPVR